MSVRADINAGDKRRRLHIIAARQLDIGMRRTSARVRLAAPATGSVRPSVRPSVGLSPSVPANAY